MMRAISGEILAACRARTQKTADTLLAKHPGTAASKMAQAAMNDAGILHILALDYLNLRAGQTVAAGNSHGGNACTQTFSTTGANEPVPSGQRMDAPVVDPNSHVGQQKVSGIGQTMSADMRTPLRGGQGKKADGHQNGAPSQAIIRPKPGKPRGIEAIAAAGVVVGESLLKNYRVRDGRPIGAIKWHELEKLARENDRESRTFRYLIGHIANAPSHASVADLVSEKTLADAFKFAEAADNA